MDYEYAPESQLSRSIMASAAMDDGDMLGWEPWRLESYPHGEQWYRRPIEGSEDDPAGSELVSRSVLVAQLDELLAGLRPVKLSIGGEPMFSTDEVAECLTRLVEVDDE